MPADAETTEFAPAERAAPEDLRRQSAYFSEQSVTRHLLDAIPSILFILNAHRQVVFANRHLLDLVGADHDAVLHGMRAGEVLGCGQAGRAQGGCGTAEACRSCGASLTVLASLEGRRDVQECRILRENGGTAEAVDLLVSATPLEFQDDRFTVFSATDISHEKRRQALERVFFHDVLNVVGSIRGFAELLRDYDLEKKEEIFELIHAAAEQAIGEIEGQRMLSSAENGDLMVNGEPFPVQSLVSDLVCIYRRHEVAEGREIRLDEAAEGVIMKSDPTLLGRVLGNMIKNALEATAKGAAVTVGWAAEGSRIEFRVHNPGCIPRERQLQIFRRSFSTKGVGRGLGTYSMRLLSSYLGGEVSFTSSEEEGTVFRASYPLEMAD